MEWLIIYLVFINIIAAAVCVADKKRSKRPQMRISEKTLIFLSVIGGSVGMYFAMYAVRHKTRRRKFTIGIPVIIACQIAACYLLLTKL